MRGKLKYPQDFIERVMKTYPENEVLHRLLKMGAVDDVGKYLRKITPQGISATRVLSARNLNELQEEALEIINKQKLYAEWEKIRKGEDSNEEAHM